MGGLCVAVAFVLAACGGGEQAETATARLSPNQVATPAPETEASARLTHSTMQEGARLNAAELDQIAKTGVLPEPFEGPLLSGAEGSTPATLNPSTESTAAQAKSNAEQKSAASRVPAYRFYNGSTGAHFSTTSITERDNVIATQPQFSFEGPAFYVSATSVPGLSPVHRFYNAQTGVHFYTISEAERANVAATLPQFDYEGIGYYASTLSGTGYTPLYRFYVSARGFHFYTNSLAERDNIIATLPQYSYEGIGYYVLGDDWQTPAVPHTGISQSQCYRPDSNTLVTCLPASPIQVFPDESLALNPQQDGHRTTINSISYSAVANPNAGTLATCATDNVTGLLWERKSASGYGGVNDTFTAAQATGYVAGMNFLKLCGFSDWRLPTVEELYNIVNFLVPLPGPTISGGTFTYTALGNYLTSTTLPGASRGVSFQSGELAFVASATPAYVRLVRGAPWTGQRYLVTSAIYSGDGINNAVIDRRTGLTWRRCVEGQTWSGSACLGSGTSYNHQGAFFRAKGQAGWRLPNIKELSSLSDHGRTVPALDPVSFPGAMPADTWSSTPFVTDSTVAWVVNSSNASAKFSLRGESLAVRLVMSTP